MLTNFQSLSHENMSIPQTEGFLKIPIVIFGRTYALSVGFKMKSLKQEFSCVKTKTKSNFAVEIGERSNHSFSIYLMNHLKCIKHLYCLICDSGIY